jgi:LysM repeat protein
VNEALLSPSNFRLSRRQLLAGAAVGAAAGATLVAGVPAAEAAPRPNDPHHLVWAWQFSVDAAPNFIGARLRDNNLGLLLKTHDGIEWMGQYDKSPFAVSGPAQVQTLARYYEDAGVPFHAWAVLKGIDVIREARMAADVLGAGVRSLYLDIEPFDGFWRGSGADALAFGKELRRLQPNARVVASVDPRPWIVQRLPLREFASFSNEIAPQNYWRSFNTQPNRDKYAQSGYPTPAEGVTPEFLADVANAVYGGYGLPISPVGQGAGDVGEWQRFLNKTYSLGSKTVSVWRYGVAPVDVFSLLRDRPPYTPPPPTPAVAAGSVVVSGSGVIYTVQSGDSLSAISNRFGVPMDAIVQVNSLSDPGAIYVGQKLTIPGTTTSDAVSAAAVSSDADSSQAASGGQSYTVQSGDTLGGIASRFGRSAGAVADANGMSDPNVLAVGQVLQIP